MLYDLYIYNLCCFLSFKSKVLLSLDFSFLYMSFYNNILRFSGLHKKVASLINELVNLDNKSILDVGGGSGLLAEYISRFSSDITILEPSKKFLDKGKDFNKICKKIQDVKNFDVKYDVVVCFDSLHHFSNGEKDDLKSIKKGIENMVNLSLKKLVIIEPNPFTFRGAWIRFIENGIFRIGSRFLEKEEFETLFPKNSILMKWSYFYVLVVDI